MDPETNLPLEISAMSARALVSIIVPIFDVEQHLERCVDSILGQSYPRIEVILVNDGSPDRCAELCDSYAARDSRVRVIHQVNAGVSAARNTGLDVAKGELLMFIDGDDWVEPDMTTHLVCALEEHEADIAAGGLRLSTTLTEWVPARRDSVRRLTTRQALDLYGGPLVSAMTSPCCKVYRRALFDGIRFPVARFYEDEFVTYRVIGRAHTVALSSAELYHYCFRVGSATGRPQGAAQMHDRALALTQRGHYFVDRGMDKVAAVSYRTAFIAARLAASVDRETADSVRVRASVQAARSLAKRVVRADPSLKYRLLAGTYVIAPSAVDVALRLRHQVVLALSRGWRRMTGHSQHGESPVTE